MKSGGRFTFALQTAVQLVFMGIFIFLFIQKKMPLWFFVFGSGVIASMIFSRFYCGWMCPMKTLFRPVNWLYSKLKIKRLKMPSFIHPGVLRYSILALVLGFMAFTKWKGISVPVPLIITVIAVLFVLVFDESFWHNSVCPYGTILHHASRKPMFSVRINESLCIPCGKCQKVCPSDAIDTLATKKRIVRVSDCLTCGACIPVCPTNAISFRNESFDFRTPRA